jgi:hypothetical protein
LTSNVELRSYLQLFNTESHTDNFFPGRNKKLGLSGRKSRDVGILSTSKLYSLHDRVFAFTPQVSLVFVLFYAHIHTRAHTWTYTDTLRQIYMYTGRNTRRCSGFYKK